MTVTSAKSLTTMTSSVTLTSPDMSASPRAAVDGPRDQHAQGDPEQLVPVEERDPGERRVLVVVHRRDERPDQRDLEQPVPPAMIFAVAFHVRFATRCGANAIPDRGHRARPRGRAGACLGSGCRP